MYREAETRSRATIVLERVAIAHGGRRRLALGAAIFLIGLALRIDFAREPFHPQAPDARGYARIAETLYEDGRFEQRGNFVPRDIQDPSNYSPGLPLLVAGLYELRGEVDLRFARIVLALIGSLAILFAYLIGRRLGGSGAGLLAAAPVAVYPALLENHGMLMTEPLAASLLAASVLAILRAGDRRSARAWLWPGALFGAMAMVRPEYLLFGAMAPALAFAWSRRNPGGGRPLAAAAIAAIAFALVIAPWTLRNLIALDRWVPISTGAGKVLFIGADLPADAQLTAVRQNLLERSPGLRRDVIQSYSHGFAPGTSPWILTSQLEPPDAGLDPQLRLSQRIKDSAYPYLDSVLDTLAARRFPGQPAHLALARLGREKLARDITEQPIELLGLIARKTVRAWTYGPRRLLTETPFALLHAALVVFGLAGLVLLALRRRREAIPIGAIVIGVSAMCAVLIASPRRVVVLIPLVAALAGVAITSLARRTASLRA